MHSEAKACPTNNLNSTEFVTLDTKEFLTTCSIKKNFFKDSMFKSKVYSSYLSLNLNPVLSIPDPFLRGRISKGAIVAAA